VAVAERHGIVVGAIQGALSGVAGVAVLTSEGAASVADDARETVVTVMVADVRGFTTMTRARAPADMAERMRSFFRWSRREVESHKGLVDEFRGDSVMATFNVSAARLDHTLAAVRTAVALVDKAALMDLPVGVGIAVGPSVIGHLTGDPHVRVLGDPVNLASRLQAQASAGELLLSEEAFRRASDWLASHGIEPEPRELVLKGIAGPVVTRVVRVGDLVRADQVRALEEP
jgi:adenylate cyclase